MKKLLLAVVLIAVSISAYSESRYADISGDVSAIEKVYLSDCRSCSAEKKIDMIFERVEVALSMFPKYPRVKIEILGNKTEISKKHSEIYGVRFGKIGFYSKKTRTVYLSGKNISAKLIAHELAHAIIEMYFEKSPPDSMHELMAIHAHTHF